MTSKSSFQVCKPKTEGHRRGMKWFSSITRAHKDRALGCLSVNHQSVNLAHATKLYGVFAETGDARYLALCEDFLQHSLSGTQGKKVATFVSKFPAR
ncbi:MAG: hypothetical protein R3C68_13405 [Myxococcota bacterium]